MNLDDRMFLRGQAIYEQMVRGEVKDVEAELMDAHFEESGREEEKK